MKMRIFISYCHDDVFPDDGRLKVFIDALEEAGKGTYEILVDYKHEKAAIGESLPQFMKEIDTIDAVILLLTPGYRERVERKGNSGVYFEFRRIYDRLLESLSKRTYNRNFVILPLIFTGSFKDSCPSEIKHIHCEDLTWLHVVPKSKKPKIRREFQSKFLKLISDISARVNAIAETRSSAYDQRKGKIFRNFLFRETKSAWDKPENYKYIDTAFVKTSVFLKARDHEISFVVGRKGAGKSALTHVLPVLSDLKPTLTLRVEFEDLPLSSFYNIFLRHPAEASDLRTAFLSIYSYQYAWDVFFYMFFLWQVWNVLSKEERARTPKVLGKLINTISSTAKTERNSVATRTFFEHALEQLEIYIGQIIRGKDSTDLPGLTGLMSNFTISGFREHIFGRKGWEILDKLISQYKKMNERVLITADGFDTMVGVFTAESSDTESAIRFERDLLLSLFQIVINKGPGRVVGGGLYEISDFCIAVPHDRFPEIRLRDRDRYRYRSVARITWSGLELSSLVRKRLALLRDVPDTKIVKDEKIPIEERLEMIIRRGYPELPHEISFQFGSANYRMPLFIYVLRHTFWRPRDILHYYANLLAAAEGFGKKKEAMPIEFARQVISGSTRSIVEDEFLAEFESSFRNLRDVLMRFRHGPQVISWGELRKKIENVRFETLLFEGEIASLEWKAEVLYDLGVLGVVLDRKTSERLSAYRHAFSFNEDQLLTDKLARDEYSNFRYAFNPVLIEFLQLDTTNNPELILPMDWKYLHDNEILRGIASSLSVSNRK
ncbi:MAG: toll/interleukin-1 receptor domain-containing protein [Chloroflexi bacterium]|nr:toll/interleukin-1 receptor domain-containing protein [Chloroflexota bacterium]